MSHEILKKNLEFLMQQYNLDVNTLEKKAGVRKNNVYNIMKDRSKEPSAELVQSGADVFDLTVKDLLTDSKIYPALTSRDLDLLVSVTKNICNELKTENVTVAFHQAISLIKEVFDYCYGPLTLILNLLSGLLKINLINTKTSDYTPSPF